MSRGSFLNPCMLKAIRTHEKMQDMLQADTQKTFKCFGLSHGGTPVEAVGNGQGKGRGCSSFGSGFQRARKTGVLLFSKCLGGY